MNEVDGVVIGWLVLSTTFLYTAIAMTPATAAPQKPAPIRLTDPDRLVCAPYTTQAGDRGWSCKTAGDVSAWILHNAAR